MRQPNHHNSCPSYPQGYPQGYPSPYASSPNLQQDSITQRMQSVIHVYPRQVLSGIESDVRNALSHYPSIGLSVNASSLLSINGTIPIDYRGSQYQIPVEIVLSHVFPTRNPTCFVRPTESMMIKPKHPHCGADGTIYCPYLSDWVYGKSTLLGLVHHLCALFSRDPPVRAKPKQDNTQHERQQERVRLLTMLQSSIRTQLVEMRQQVEDLTDILRVTKQEMRDNEREGAQIQSQLHMVESEKHTTLLRISETEANLEELESIDLEHLNVDLATNADNAVAQTLIEQVAASEACSDVMYMLTKYFKTEQMDLKEFLKHYRRVAEKKYMCEALVQKCSEMIK